MPSAPKSIRAFESMFWFSKVIITGIQKDFSFIPTVITLLITREFCIVPGPPIKNLSV
jgi:hypothetical protein